MNEKARQRAGEILDELLDLMASKAGDYSRDDTAINGMQGINSRLVEKAIRLRTVWSKNGQANHETLRETLGDTLNYALMGLLYEEGLWTRSTYLVYLAGPIDGITTGEAANWRQQTGRTLAHYGVATFDPYGAYHLVLPASYDIAHAVGVINRFAIEQCQAVLVNLSGRGRSIGTLREIEFARAHNKRVIVVLPNGTPSLEAHDLEVVDTLADAIAALVGVDATTAPIPPEEPPLNLLQGVSDLYSDLPKEPAQEEK